MLDDGGGIYVWNDPTNPVFTGRKIQNNLVLNGIGSGEGTNIPTQTYVDGLYLDDGAQQVELSGNTVAFCTRNGLFLHNAHEINAHNNTLFHNLRQINYQQDKLTSLIQNNIIKSNIFVAKVSTEGVSSYRNYLTFPVGSLGVADSNYYARPINDNMTMHLGL